MNKSYVLQSVDTLPQNALDRNYTNFTYYLYRHIKLGFLKLLLNIYLFND